MINLRVWAIFSETEELDRCLSFPKKTVFLILILMQIKDGDFLSKNSFSSFQP